VWQSHGTSVTAVRDFTASFEPGIAHFICGPSGCGKSTLGYILAGLMPPSSGQVTYAGQPVAGNRQHVAYLFQSPEAIFFNDTVQKELEEISDSADADLWEKSFQRVGVSLPEIAHRHPFTLSEGYARLTALAMQFTREVNVMILDEPTIGLDWKHQQRVMDVLKAAVAPERILVTITHDLELLAALQGKSWVLADGLLAWSGRTADLLADDDLLRRFALRA